MTSAYGTLTDITDRKQAEEHQRTLARTERLHALGEMASGVAHDLNQSLCVKPAKTNRGFGGSRTRKTVDGVQPKRSKTYSGFG